MKTQDKYLGEATISKKPIVIVSNEDGDWEAIYVKGKVFYQSHEITMNDFIEAAEKAGILRKNSVDYISDYDMGDDSHLPNKLEDIKI